MTAPSRDTLALLLWLAENLEGKAAHFAAMPPDQRQAYEARAAQALRRAGPAWLKPHWFSPLRNSPGHCKVCRYPASEKLKHLPEKTP